MLASMLIPIINILIDYYFLKINNLGNAQKKYNQRKVSGHIHHKGHIEDMMNTDNKDREYARSCFGKAEGFELNILKRKILIFEEEPSSPYSFFSVFVFASSLLGLKLAGSKRETEEKEERRERRRMMRRRGREEGVRFL